MRKKGECLVEVVGERRELFVELFRNHAFSVQESVVGDGESMGFVSQVLDQV